MKGRGHREEEVLNYYPFGTIGLIIVGWFMDPKWISNETGGSERWQWVYCFLIRYCIPLVLLATFAARIVRHAG
jgi:hypothetical protein